jgi:Flp pilus assembly protein TadG
MLRLLRDYWNDEQGTALIEAAMLIPAMVTLLMGVYDVGNGIILNQRTITASQIAADLVARDFTVNGSQIDEAVEAARLSFQPYTPFGFGIDMVSVEFDDDGNPSVIWRETQNMAPNEAAVDSIEGLGEDGDGMIIVTVRYTYVPHFAQMFIHNFNMQEVAFTRGRRSPVVRYAS